MKSDIFENLVSDFNEKMLASKKDMQAFCSFT